MTSSTVLSPFSKNASKSCVATVGTIFTLLKLSPLTVTPAGTVNGNVSVYTPGRICIVGASSPLLTSVAATLNACATDANGSCG